MAYDIKDVRIRSPEYPTMEFKIIKDVDDSTNIFKIMAEKIENRMVKSYLEEPKYLYVSHYIIAKGTTEVSVIINFKVKEK